MIYKNINNYKNLKIGSHIFYAGAFNITPQILQKFNIPTDLSPTHHAIYIGDNKIVHFKRGYNFNKFNSIIELDKFENFIETAKKIQQKVIIVNEKDSLPSDEIVKRSLNFIGKKNYNLITNNCEHLVRYCITGQSESKQIQKYLNYLINSSKNYYLDENKKIEFKNEVLPTIINQNNTPTQLDKIKYSLISRIIFYIQEYVNNPKN